MIQPLVALGLGPWAGLRYVATLGFSIEPDVDVHTPNLWYPEGRMVIWTPDSRNLDWIPDGRF